MMSLFMVNVIRDIREFQHDTKIIVANCNAK
jgi:hypothetical protein